MEHLLPLSKQITLKHISFDGLKSTFFLLGYVLLVVLTSVFTLTFKVNILDTKNKNALHASAGTFQSMKNKLKQPQVPQEKLGKTFVYKKKKKKQETANNVLVGVLVILQSQIGPFCEPLFSTWADKWVLTPSLCRLAAAITPITIIRTRQSGLPPCLGSRNSFARLKGSWAQNT